jgi:hypothetical protein
MVIREDRKKQWELDQGNRVAKALNFSEGTDYEVRPSGQEPADVILESPSGRFPSRPAQVVSIPLDFRFRSDKHSIQKFQGALKGPLEERGARHALVGIILSREAESHGVPPRMVQELADLIICERSDGHGEFRYDELNRQNPELLDFFHVVNVSHHPGIIDGVEIDIPAGGPVPADGRWIQEGIAKKLGKYGGQNAVRNLALIVGVAGFIDGAQIRAFQETSGHRNSRSQKYGSIQPLKRLPA